VSGENLIFGFTNNITSSSLFFFLFLQQKRNKMPPLHLMLLKSLLRLGQCIPHHPPWAEEKKVNGDVLLRPKLMNIPVGLGIKLLD